MIAKSENQKNILPYSDFGLTERKAAAYLLDRFAFGARPGEVDQLLEIGLETWFNRQLNVDFPNQQLNEWSPKPLNECINKQATYKQTSKQLTNK